VTLFAGIRATDARSIAGPVVDVEVAAGTELISEGAIVGTFFVIRSGTAQLTRNGHPVGTLIAGDGFGEIDPRDASPQRYTVSASSPLRLLTFSAFGMARLCDAIPGAREHILESVPGSQAEVLPLRRPSDAQPARALAAG
jgi:CRP-like cAMP-binding protein